MPDTHIQVGVRDGNAMSLTDAMSAVNATWGDEVPAPPHVDTSIIETVVAMTADANRNAGRTMGYGATLAWGISIGIHAERHRIARLLP